MNKLYLIIIFCILIFNSYAQDTTLEIKLNKKEKIVDYGLLNADTFLLEFYKDKDKSFTLIDSDLNIKEERKPKLYLFDNLEEEELYGEMNRNYIYNSSTSSKNEVPLVKAHMDPGGYGVSQVNNKTTKIFTDIRNISFYNSNNFVLIGRKNGEDHYFVNECEKSIIYIYTKDIENGVGKYIELVKPKSKKKWSYPVEAKLLYYDDSKFHLVYDNSSKSEKKYLLVSYNYNGEVLSENIITNSINDIENYGRGYLNYYSPSVTSYQPHTINSFYDERMKPNDHTAITNNQFSASLDREGDIIYDHINEVLYVYSALYDKSSKKSGLSIAKYNKSFAKVWTKVFYEDDLKLPMILCDYKISRFFVKEGSIYINLLSTFNNKMNKLYVLNSKSGELKFSKEYKKPEFIRKAYHGFRAPFIVKEYFGKNIGVNTVVLNSYETNDKVKKYIDTLDKKEDMMLFGYYINDGIIIIKILRKKDTIEFNKFKF